jgi:hypothetical protein
VKRSILEDASRGYLHNDTVIIKYTIELVVSSGGWGVWEGSPTVMFVLLSAVYHRAVAS